MCFLEPSLLGAFRAHPTLCCVFEFIQRWVLQEVICLVRLGLILLCPFRIIYELTGVTFEKLRVTQKSTEFSSRQSVSPFFTKRALKYPVCCSILFR